jgi:hypothetical protein
MKEIDQKTAERLLDYCRETGVLTWKLRDRDLFQTDKHWKWWNKRFSGTRAFPVTNNHGYMTGAIFGRKFSAHRVCWLIHTGSWPNGDIDHIDGNKANNAIKNLRDCSTQQNMRNQRKSSRNTTGITGVYWHKRANKWTAAVGIDGKVKSLGYFKNKEDAAEARLSANIAVGFSQRHGS